MWIDIRFRIAKHALKHLRTRVRDDIGFRV